MEREQLIKELFQDAELQTIIKENKLDKRTIDNNLIPLTLYMIEKKICHSCSGLDECKQTVRGHQPLITFNNEQVIVDYTPCDYEINQNVARQKKQNLKLIACSFASFNGSLYASDNRSDVLNYINQVYKDAIKKKHTKGLYLYGSYGSGKTYILASLAERLADKGLKVIFAYYPDLVRQIKSSIGEGVLEQLVEELKTIEVLFLDDFGGDTNSDFIRDEVLGPILQERMTSERLTFMSSNLDKKLLVEHLSQGNKEIDRVKASRIYERIATLMNFMELKDQNHRHN